MQCLKIILIFISGFLVFKIIEKNKNKYISKTQIKLQNINLDNEILLPNIFIKKDFKIPKFLFQTYNDKNKIPKKIFDNIEKYASDYEYSLYDDEKCKKFLKDYFIPKVLDRFNELKGAHKADLWRYCILYVFGGIYLDIKTILVKPLNEIFDHDNKYEFYSSISTVKNNIYQGVLAVNNLNKIMKNSINFIVNSDIDEINKNYIIFTEFLFQDLKNQTFNNNIISGENILKNINKIYLFTEQCCNDKTCPFKTKDRYGLFCKICNEQNEIMFNTRFIDFPW